MAYVSDKTGFAGNLRSLRDGSADRATPQKARKPRQVPGYLYGLPLLIAFFALWEIAPRAGWLNRIFFPPLSEVCVLVLPAVISNHNGDHR